MTEDTVHITLRGEAARLFEEFKEQVEEDRNGIELSHAEMGRMLLGQFDPSKCY